MTFVATRPAESEQRIFRPSDIILQSFCDERKPFVHVYADNKKHKLDLHHNHSLAVYIILLLFSQKSTIKCINLISSLKQAMISLKGSKPGDRFSLVTAQPLKKV